MKKIKLSFVCKFIITIKETNYYSVFKVMGHLAIICRQSGNTVASTGIASYASPSIDSHVS